MIVSTATSTSALLEEDVDEAIIVEVDDYQPSVIRSSVLEQQNVPVYVFLKGATIGSLLSGSESPGAAPLYGIPDIKYVNIIPRGTITEERTVNQLQGGQIYVPPQRRNYVADESGRFIDLGYLILRLRMIEKEEDIPDSLDLNYTIEVVFDLENTLGKFGSQDLELKEYPIEEKWKTKPTGPDPFWGGTGYIRAKNIKDNSVTFEVYDSYLKSKSSFSLNPGEESRAVRIKHTSDLYNDFLRVKLDKIDTPKIKADILVLKNGYSEIRSFNEGDRIYQGSKWKITDMAQGIIGTDIYQQVELENYDGDIKTLERTIKKDNKIITTQSNSELEEKIKPYETFIESTNGIDKDLIKEVII